MASIVTLDSTEARGTSLQSAAPAKGHRQIWGFVSTWGLLVVLLYFAVNGVSPLQNGLVSMRMAATASAGMSIDTVNNILVVAACSLLVLKELRAIGSLSLKMPLVTCFPILALVLLPVSQQITRSISSGAVLVASTLLVYYLLCKYTFDEVMEIFLVLGVIAIGASILSAVALPQVGIDEMGPYYGAWKGIFSAKNHFGNMALFFLTTAIAYRGRTSFFKCLRVIQIVFCLIAIAFAHAATAWALTCLYLVYATTMPYLRRFTRKDFLVVGAILVAVSVLFALVIVSYPDLLLRLMNKDATLTGRTGIWEVLSPSIAQRPWFGYGYHAFWLGYEGESARVLITLGWVLNQAQSGFVDVLLEMGIVGLIPVVLLFLFAFRDGLSCLLRSTDPDQLRMVEWYLAIVALTLIYNTVESFLFEPRHLASMMFILACTGLRLEWSKLQAAARARTQILMWAQPQTISLVPR